MITQKQRQQYLKTQVQTASKEQLVLMLFDGAIRFCENGKQAIENGEIEPMHVNLVRAQNIIMELNYTLDRKNGGEIAENLARLYGYSLLSLVEANLRRKASKVDEVLDILRPIRESWLGAMEKLKRDAAEANTEETATQTSTPVATSQPVPSNVIPLPPLTRQEAAARPRLSVEG